MGTLKKTLKQNFDWDVADLTPYTDEDSQDIARRAVFTGRTAALLTAQEVRGGNEKIKKFDSTVTYQAAACEATASGNDDWGQRFLDPVKVMVFKKFCNDDIKGFYPQKNLPMGAAAEMKELPFQDQVVNYILDKHSFEYDNLLWRGDKAGAGNLAFINGLKKKIDESPSAINANTAGTSSLTSSNAYSQFRLVARDLPSAIQVDGTGIMFCGLDAFNLLQDDLFDSNYFNFSMVDYENNRLTLPGTNVTVQAVPGLSGSAGQYGIYATSTENLFLGTSGDEGSAEVFYHQKDDAIYLRIQFYVDVNYAFADQIVKWNLGGS